MTIRYDKDGSGSIEIDEMVEIVGNLFELEGLSKVNNIIIHLFKLVSLSINSTQPVTENAIGRFEIYSILNGNVSCNVLPIR